MISLVIGGSGSGKSEYAENEVLTYGARRRIYVATMKPWDEECVRRIERHRRLRAAKGFETVEWHDHLERLTLPVLECEEQDGRPVVLLECLSNLISNEMFSSEFEETGVFRRPDGDKTASIQEEIVVNSVVRGVCRLENQAEALIVVTNEVFSDGGIDQEWTRRYIAVLAAVNRKLAGLAGRVVEVVVGIPVLVKEIL